MRLWLSKNSEVPLREQLVTQIVLGIVSNDLKAGQRLPSTRELARRYKVHSNTVSAAYRELAKRRWVEFRKGSGVYVRVQANKQPVDGYLKLDQLIAASLNVARDKGFPLHEIQFRLKHWLGLQPPDHFLVIDPDPELRRILLAEIKAATGMRAVGADLEECANAEMFTGAEPIAMYGQAEAVRAALPPEAHLLILRSRSVPESMQQEKLPPPEALIAVVSRYPDFLRRSRAILVAAGLDPEALSFRDAREPGWEKGLRSTAFVITDALMARLLPADCVARVFRIIADSSVVKLRSYAEQFFKR